MLVTWRYRKRKSLIQSFDPRAWIIFYGCFMVSSIFILGPALSGSTSRHRPGGGLHVGNQVA